MLRAWSALIVVLFHSDQVIRREVLNYANPAGPFGFGHAGVDVFFVISGFIITYVHGHEMGKMDRVAPFLIKRFFRIYPVYWLLVIGVLLVAYILPGSIKAAKFDFWHVLDSFLLLPTGWAKGLPILPVAWSLYHEVKFYLAFALFLFLPPKWARIWVGLCIFLCCGYTLLYCTGIIPQEHQDQNRLSYFLLNPHNTQFLLGCAVAWLVRRKGEGRRDGWQWLLGGFVFFALAGFLEMRGDILPHRYLVVLYGLAAFALVWGCVQVPEPARKNKGWLFLVLLGNASYSIYLVHYPILGVMKAISVRSNFLMGLGWPGLLVLFVGASVVASLAFYWCVERTWLNWSRSRFRF